MLSLGNENFSPNSFHRKPQDILCSLLWGFTGLQQGKLALSNNVCKRSFQYAAVFVLGWWWWCSTIQSKFWKKRGLSWKSQTEYSFYRDPETLVLIIDSVFAGKIFCIYSLSSPYLEEEAFMLKLKENRFFSSDTAIKKRISQHGSFDIAFVA